MWNFPPPDVFYQPENPLESDCEDGPRFSRGQSRQPYFVAPPPSYWSVEQNRLQTTPSYAPATGTIFRFPPPGGCNPPPPLAEQPCYPTTQVLPCDDASSLRSSDSEDDPFLGEVPPEPMYESCSENAANSPQAVFEEEDSPQAVFEEDDQHDYNCPSEDDNPVQNEWKRSFLLDNPKAPEPNVPYPAAELTGSGQIQHPQAPICSRRYTEQDLYPKVRDPSCDPSWQLASYWPVYLANFRVDNLKEDARNAQIASFFASKGLLTRMIFVRDSDEFYLHHQSQSMLLDMLVYFTSKQDADQAIRCCHKTTFYGHRLNLFPGRVPEYFDAHRSVGFRMPKKNSVKWTETFVELLFHHHGRISTVAKFSTSEVIVEFEQESAMKAAVNEVKMWFPFRLEGSVHKQRYLEQDVKLELLWQIQENSTLMGMLPPPQVLAELKEGRLPQVDKAWENWVTPRPLPEGTVSKLESIKAARKLKLIANERARRAAKAVAREKGTEQKIVPAARGPKPIKLKQRKKLVRQQADQFLGIEPKKLPWTRVQLLRAKYNQINPKLVKAKVDLLAARVGIMDQRKDLFYKLLALETQVQTMVAESKGQLHCPALETGLLKALEKANESLPFPQMPEEPPRIEPDNNSKDDGLSAGGVNSCCDMFWPIYLSNFCVTSLDTKLRNEQVHEYFATKGLPVALIFVKQIGLFYAEYQQKTMLLDMLVYFSSKDDGQRAIQSCHRESYNGHKLNVFPGRQKLFFDNDRSGRLELAIDSMETEEFIETERLKMPPEAITSIIRHRGWLTVEFASKSHLQQACSIEPKLSPLMKAVRKQRYLEIDVIRHVLLSMMAENSSANKTAHDILEKVYAKRLQAVKKKHRANPILKRISTVLEIWYQLQKKVKKKSKCVAAPSNPGPGLTNPAVNNIPLIHQLIMLHPPTPGSAWTV